MPIEGLSDTLIPWTGKPNSVSLSATPAPNPELSTNICPGCSLGGNASYSAITDPDSCIKSNLRQTRMSVTTRPTRLHSTLASSPMRATSNDQTAVTPSAASMSRCIALSTKCSGITVSSSWTGNSPVTRVRQAFVPSPYRSRISSTYSLDTLGLSRQLTVLVHQFFFSR